MMVKIVEVIVETGRHVRMQKVKCICKTSKPPSVRTYNACFEKLKTDQFALKLHAVYNNTVKGFFPPHLTQARHEVQALVQRLHDFFILASRFLFIMMLITIGSCVNSRIQSPK